MSYHPAYGSEFSALRSKPYTKVGRAQLFERLSKLPVLVGWPHQVTDENWAELSDIVYKMRVWADAGDAYEYQQASIGFSCYDKVEAARHFVRRYAGSRIQKHLHSILYGNLKRDHV